MVGRDNNGRFVKGHKPPEGVGRKPRTDEQQIIAALEKACPLDDVLGMLHDAVMCGQDWAIKLYLAYYWHMPTQPVKSDVDITGNLKISVKLKDDGD